MKIERKLINFSDSENLLVAIPLNAREDNGRRHLLFEKYHNFFELSLKILTTKLWI